MDSLGMWRWTFLAAIAGAALIPLLSSHGFETVTVLIGGEQFRVELAISDSERRQGLMDREQLPPGTGMLFIYERPQPVRFWNKDVRFPIDILYFDENSTLLRTDTHVPPCPHGDCPLYRTEEPVKYVLELPAGTTDRLGLHPGEQLAIL